MKDNSSQAGTASPPGGSSKSSPVEPVEEQLRREIADLRRRLGAVEAEAGVLRGTVEVLRTGREQTEQALREKIEELDRFFTVALDLLCIADTDGHFRRLNPQWETVLGYPLEELEGKCFIDLVHPDDQAATLAAVGELMGQKAVLDFVNRYRCKDGSYRWIEWRSYPTGDLIYAAARDITEHTRAEEALRQQVREIERFNRLATERELRVIEMKRQINTLAKAAGQSPPFEAPASARAPEPEAEAPPAESTPPTSSSWVRGKAMADDLARQTEERDRVNQELRRQREAALSLAEDANEARMEAERAGQLLRSNERKLRTILEVSPLPISWMDAQGRIEYWNRKALDLFGYAPEEIATLEQWLLHAYPDPDYRQDASRRWNETLAAGRREGTAVHGEEYDVTCRDGTVRTMEIFGAYFDDRHLVIFNDITRRKRAEEALRASLDVKIALLKEVHHRVKNNLQIVSSLLSLQAAQVQNPLALGALQNTQNRVRSMALIHETLYRSENLARVDFSLYIENLCAHLFRAFGVDPARIQLISRVAGVALGLDEAVPCGLIINELVSNALKHAFPGERAGQITLELRAEADGQRTLRVADNGVGLPAGLDFRRVDTLGLKLVFNLADQLNGTLAWEQDDGTTFRLSFRGPLPRGGI